jgi:alpha-beta hydrolase superfamily lysophospholipase
MRHEEHRFSGAGGVEIYRQSWLPENEPRAVLVIAHGISEHSGRYLPVVERLVPQGFAVHALDHRGHGRSEGPRAVIDRLERAVADIDTVVDAAGPRPYLLGHSMGGCLAIAYTLRQPDKLAGLVLSSPVAVLEAASPVVRAVSRVLSAVVPKLGVFGLDASGISRDAEEVRLYETDPLNYHGRLPVRSVAELAAEIETFPERLSELVLPLLVMQGTADRLVPVAAGKLVAAESSSPDKTLKLYEGGYHELFHDLPETREAALDDLQGWLSARA